MKQFFSKYFALCFCFILLLSCQEDEVQPPSDMQDLAPTTMSFEVDGELFTSTMAYYRDHDLDRMSVYCENESGSSFYFHLPEFYGVATYELNQFNFLGLHAKYERVVNGDTTIYRAGPIFNSQTNFEASVGFGQFSFDSLNYENTEFTGAFEVTLHNVRDFQDTIKIANGVFSNLRVHEEQADPPVGTVGLWVEGRYFLVEAHDVRVSGAQILVANLYDYRISGLKRMRIEYPLDATGLNILFGVSNSSFVIPIDSVEINFIQAKCSSVKQPITYELDELNQTFSARIVGSTFYDVEVVFNQTPLAHPPPVNHAGTAQLNLNGETIFFDQVVFESELSSGSFQLIASNSDGQSFAIGPTIFGPINQMGGGYFSRCYDKAVIEASYSDQAGGLSAYTVGFLTFGYYPTPNGDYRNFQFNAPLGTEVDLLFGADSVLWN